MCVRSDDDHLDAPIILVGLLLRLQMRTYEYKPYTYPYCSCFCAKVLCMHEAVACATNEKYDICQCLSATHSLTKFAHFIDIRPLNMYDEWLLHKSARQVLMRLDYFILIIIICGAALSSLTGRNLHLYTHIIIVRRAIHIRRGYSVFEAGQSYLWTQKEGH